MAYVPAGGECVILTVDNLPPDIAPGDMVTLITTDVVVFRTASMLWVAENRTPDTLDAEIVG